MKNEGKNLLPGTKVFARRVVRLARMSGVSHSSFFILHFAFFP
jgi:hypothetical protein